MNVTIRLALKNDLDSICELSRQVNSEHSRNEPSVFSLPADPQRDREFWEAQLNPEKGIFLVAETEKAIVGFVTAQMSETTAITFLVEKNICRVGTIVVSEKIKRQGVGKKLMQSIERWARELSADEIRLEVMDFNETAQDFYDAIEFKNLSRILRKQLIHSTKNS